MSTGGGELSAILPLITTYSSTVHVQPRITIHITRLASADKALSSLLHLSESLPPSLPQRWERFLVSLARIATHHLLFDASSRWTWTLERVLLISFATALRTVNFAPVE
ncbi:hypothetical protein VTO42DRAFT_1810 [Malbranchea cinnamomea]